MQRVFNFNAGPAMLPTEVLERAKEEMLDWKGTGMSIMELSHRGHHFVELAEQSEKDLRELMNIPEDYYVLFLSGGATTQFAMVPLNLMGERLAADYIETGTWSKKAIAEAKRYGDVNIAAKTQYENEKAYVVAPEEWQLRSDAAYLHYTPNETIDGLEFQYIPDVAVPLVADMTSMILSRPIDVTKFGIIYAGAQKNIGQAGLNVVIIRKDLVREPLPLTPTLYSYQVQAESKCLYNTPPTYAWYIASLMFDWLKDQGGVEAIYKMNQRKAAKLYQVIDDYSHFYVNKVRKDFRSMMNVMFYLQQEALTSNFLNEAQQEGLVNLRGHRVSGGVRASIYNPMPEQAIDLLAKFMVDFAKRHG